MPNDRLYASGHPDNGLTPGGAALLAVLLREHNRRALEAALAHPDWPDQQLWQEARRWVVAHMQAVTYFEWAPNLFGNNRLQPSFTFRPSSLNESTSVEFEVVCVQCTALLRLRCRL